MLVWGLRLGAAALLLLLLLAFLPVLGFGAILALFGGLSGVPQGGGSIWGGPPTTTAVTQVPTDQLTFIQQVAASAPCSLPWTALAAVASVESGFGKTADQLSSARAYGYGQFLEGTWHNYGGDIPWRATDANELAKPAGERRDSTNYRYALPAMARYLCASGAARTCGKLSLRTTTLTGMSPRSCSSQRALWRIGVAGGGLVAGWADCPSTSTIVATTAPTRTG